MIILVAASVVLAFVAGVAVTLLLEWVFLQRCLREDDVPKPTNDAAAFQLPAVLSELVKNGSIAEPESCRALNLLCQFIFKELRNTEKVRKWFLRKLSMEFEDLITKTTTGKLFDSVAIRYLHLGTQFPVLTDVRVENVKLHQGGHIETLDLNVGVEYLGGFQLAVDCSMKLGRSAYLSVTVTHLSGRARLRFTRIPYSHWSFSFVSEPVMELKVESQFQGRPLSQVTAIIASQIRRAVRKKHTLPNFKMRYKPFFTKMDAAAMLYATPVASEVIKVTPGSLEVVVVELTRLPIEESKAAAKAAAGSVVSPVGMALYCTAAIGRVPWVSLTVGEQSGQVVLDLSVVKRGATSGHTAAAIVEATVGVMFRQEFDLERAQPRVAISKVVSGSAADRAGLHHGDLVTSVGGRPVRLVSEAVRAVRGARDKFGLRVERRWGNTATASGHPGATLTAGRGGSLPGSPTARGPLPIGLRHRRRSPDIAKDIDNESSSSQSSSQAGSPSKRDHGDHVRRASAEGSPSAPTDPDSSTEWQHTEVRSTSHKPASLDVHFEETLLLRVANGDRYLNLCVWMQPVSPASRSPSSTPSAPPTPWEPVNHGRPVLIGRLNVPLAAIAADCSTSTIGHYVKDFLLVPPEPSPNIGLKNTLSSHSGFEACMCYGDITLSFMYRRDSSPSPHPGSPTPNSHLSAPPTTPSSSPTPSPSPTPTHPGSTGGSPKRSLDGEETLPGLAQQHDFLRTHFHSATQCEFCLKKIWLKDAYRCRACSLTCHKKCVARCQANTVCSPRGSPGAGEGSNASAGDQVLQVEIAQEPGQKPDSLEFVQPTVRILPTTPQSGRRTVSSLLATMADLAASQSSRHSSGTNLKRAGSATCLAPPQPGTGQGAGPGASLGAGMGAGDPLQMSRSLPPSPQHSPTASRKSSLTCDPLELLEQVSSMEEVSESVMERLVSSASDERLVAAAKEEGKRLYSELSLPLRREKLDAMLSRLQSAVDVESDRRATFARMMAGSSTEERAKSTFLAAKSEERLQALALLMLYFCTGLQHVQDLEDQIKKEAAKVASEASEANSDD